MDLALLDTDMLSETFRGRNPLVLHHVAAYLQAHGDLYFSDFSRFEVVRGLRAKQATTQLQQFDVFWRNCKSLPVTDAILDRAAELWSQGKQIGRIPSDTDVIIASTALTTGRMLVTGNFAHFSWMPGLRLANWRLL